MILLVSFVSAMWCYQETANVSTECGGLDTGSYTVTNNSYYFLINYSKPIFSSNNSLWQVKHGYNNSNYYLYNISLPPLCFEQEPIQLGIFSRHKPGGGFSFTSRPICYNSTDWENVGITASGSYAGGGSQGFQHLLYDGDWDTQAYFYGTAPNYWLGGGAVGTSAQVFEEAMYWDLDNNVSINIYWEDNASLVEQDVFIDFTSGFDTYSVNTSTGLANLYGVASGVYSVKASGDGLEDKYYSMTVDNQTNQRLNVYFDDNYNNVTLLFQDKGDGTVIEGVYVSLSRYINDSLTIVASKLTDVTGTVKFKYVSGTYYQISTFKNDYVSRSITFDPIESSNYIVKLVSGTDEVYINDGVGLYYEPIIFSEGLNNFSFSIVSPLGLLSSYWFNISYPNGDDYYSGNNVYGELFDIDFSIVNPSFYDVVTLEYYYVNSVGEGATAVYYFPINFVNASSTTWSNWGNNYDDLGIFERIMISVLVVILLAGFGYLMAGFEGSMAMGLIVWVFFVVTGFIPLWSILIALFVGITLLIGRGSS